MIRRRLLRSVLLLPNRKIALAIMTLALVIVSSTLVGVMYRASPYSKEVTRTGAMDTKQACIAPTLDENDPVMKQQVKWMGPPLCKGDEWLRVDNGRVWFSKWALKKNRRFTCDYHPLYYISDSEVRYLEPIKNIPDGFQMVSDFFKGACTSDVTGASNTAIYAGVYHSQERSERSAGAGSLEEGLEGLSVAVLSFDSMSRMSWIRRLKRTRQYFVDKLGAIELEHHNIVGEGTTAAMFPMLTGKFEAELPPCRTHSERPTYLDDFPFIWHEMRRAGYLTSWCNGEPGSSCFNSGIMGFSKVPTDFYIRPYFMAVNAEGDPSNLNKVTLDSKRRDFNARRMHTMQSVHKNTRLTAERRAMKAYGAQDKRGDEFTVQDVDKDTSGGTNIDGAARLKRDIVSADAQEYSGNWIGAWRGISNFFHSKSTSDNSGGIFMNYINRNYPGLANRFAPASDQIPTLMTSPAAALNNTLRPLPDEECVGPRRRADVWLDYFLDIFRQYPRQRKFLVHHTSDFSHDNNKITKLDTSITRTLQILQDDGQLNRTVLILMGDHGARYGSTRHTHAGKMEERLPYFAILFPPWFPTKHPQAFRNVRTNSHRLTTPFDIHETFRDFLKFGGSGLGNVHARGISLFKEIPASRTCQHAGITPHWCSCLDSTEFSPQDPLIQRALDEALKAMNAYTEPYRTECALLALESVSSAKLLGTQKDLFIFSNSGSVGETNGVDFEPHITYGRVPFQLSFFTTPGGGRFELTITYEVGEERFSLDPGDVSRINAHGQQSQCVADKNTDIQKFCFCNNNLP